MERAAMAQSWRLPSWSKHLAVALVLAALYVAAARLGLALALPPEGKATAVWPASGIALAAVLLLGYRVWPGIWLGAFLANLWDFFGPANEFSLTAHLAVSAGIATGSTLQPLLGGYLLRRWTGQHVHLDRARTVFQFFGVALLMCLVAATAGVTSMYLAGFTSWANFGFNWWTWWLGDTVGVLVITPLALAWSKPPRTAGGVGRLAEVGVLVAVLAGVGLWAFEVWTPWGIHTNFLVYLTVPPLVWAAFRSGQHGATLTLLLICGIAVWGTAQGHGPFVQETLNESLIWLQTFIGVLTVTALALAGVVAERQRAEAAMRQSVERLRSAQQAGQVGIWEWDLRTRKLLWDGLEPIHGLAPGAFGGTFEEHLAGIHPEDRDMLVTAATLAVERGTGLELDYRIIWPDASVHWVHAKGQAFRDDKGPTVRLTGTCQDITPRKEAEEEARRLAEGMALWESETRFRSLVESANDAIVIADADGKIVSWNRAAQSFFGYTAEKELLGQPITLLMPPRYHEAHRRGMERLRRTGKSNLIGNTIELQARRKDGSELPIELSLASWQTRGERFFSGIIRDITERKAAEAQAREALRRELLLNEEIHHRVKNNLQVVSSLLYLQSLDIHDLPTLEILKDSQSRVKSIALVHEKLCRSEDLEKLDFGEYARDLIAALLGTYGVQQHNVSVHTHIQDIYLGIDTAIACGLIISELVSNALKHAFPNGRKGELSVEFHSPGDMGYTLTVRDNGVGLPEGFSVEKSRSLGLQLVRDLTTQLDGKLAVETGDGTAFHITFREPLYRERW